MSAEEAATLFPVGKIVGFRGLSGEIKIRPHTNSPELLVDIEEVRIVVGDGPPVTAHVDHFRLEKRLIVLRLSEFPDRTAAETLEGAEVYVDRRQVGELADDEWWVSDLVGLPVFTTTGEFVGEVLSVIESGNQILEISSAEEGKTILVPFVRDLVPKVDIRSCRIEVVDLPGLLTPQ